MKIQMAKLKPNIKAKKTIELFYVRMMKFI